MFIKATTKTDKKTNKRYSYYRLCESIELARHRAIVNLGDLSELTSKEDRKLLTDRIEEIIRGKGGFV